jgi:hypothetical protein
MNEKKEKSKFKLASILPHIIGAAIGLLFVFFFVDNNVQKSTGESSFALEFVPILILLISFSFGTVLHVVLHELGHLICGLLSGYRFISFSVGHMMLVKENGKLKKKKYGVAGVSGQCLMSPPEPVNGAYPFLLYNLGGCCMNFIVSGIFLTLFLVLREVVAYSEFIFLPIAFEGVILGIINVLPIKMGGISTDGHNIVSLQKSELSRRDFWVLLTISARMARGGRLNDLPDSWFEVTEGYDFNDTISANVATLRLGWLIEHHDFAEAKALAERILHEGEKLVELLKNEVRCELLFLEIIGEENPKRQDSIEQLYTHELKKYIKSSKNQLPKLRLMYAYEKIVSRNDGMARKYYESFKKNSLTYPYAGDLKTERELLEIVDELAKKYADDIA